MKRRRFVRALVGVPAATVLVAQQPQQQNNRPAPTSPTGPPMDATTPPAPFNRTVPPAAEPPKLEFAIPDDAAVTMTHYFNADQMATLRKLCDVIHPKLGNSPGALETGTPEFLDFYISRSPKKRQDIYANGLQALQQAARQKFNRPFAECDATQITALLAPLKEKWTYDPPKDSTALFLREAKQDIRSATMNSKEYIASASSSGSRRFGGSGLYWYPLD